MPTCEPNVRETRQGAGPCQIHAEVRKRSGNPNWWCRTHGMDASAPDGNALSACPGSWLDPVPLELQLDIDLKDGQVAVWGALPAAITIGNAKLEPGKVHVHHRLVEDGPKDIDASFDIVRLHNGHKELVVEGMAAVAYSLSQLSGRAMTPLACRHCGEIHIDELKFATYPHRKHLCNSCGRSFMDSSGPSVSNPLARAHDLLGLAPAPAPVRHESPLLLDTSDYGTIMIWPANAAIVSTMSRPEELGIHVHAWSHDGVMMLDETYSSLAIDGVLIDEAELRRLAVQRALAHGTPVLRLACTGCNSWLPSPADGWVEPATTHTCAACGAVTRTRRKVFVNPLGDA